MSHICFRYGFVTFATREPVDRLLSQKRHRIMYKDRKLNIGPAYYKQVIYTVRMQYSAAYIVPYIFMFSHWLWNGIPFNNNLSLVAFSEL